MPKRWEITQEAFDKLLAWLDPDREVAGKRYEEIRQSLVKIFFWRGFSDAEDLADETINRVSRKAEGLAESFEGEPALYFFGVARKVVLERRRLPSPQSVSEQMPAPPEPSNDVSNSERIHECLDRCLQRLKPAERDLILRYYQESKQAKIDFRKVLADEQGVDIETLRVKMYRVRVKVQKCMEKCLEQGASGDTD